MDGIHGRLPLVLAAAAAVIGGSIFVAARYLPGTADVQAEEPLSGPLVPEPMLPRSEEAIVWYGIQAAWFWRATIPI